MSSATLMTTTSNAATLTTKMCTALAATSNASSKLTTKVSVATSAAYQRNINDNKVAKNAGTEEKISRQRIGEKKKQ